MQLSQQHYIELHRLIKEEADPSDYLIQVEALQEEVRCTREKNVEGDVKKELFDSFPSFDLFELASTFRDARCIFVVLVL